MTALPSEHPPLRADADSAPGLTRREKEIAGLVAAGLTNREISARLFLSRRTVETYVAGAFAKTGAANRIQLAEWVRTGGLIPPAAEIGVDEALADQHRRLDRNRKKLALAERQLSIAFNALAAYEEIITAEEAAEGKDNANG